MSLVSLVIPALTTAWVLLGTAAIRGVVACRVEGDVAAPPVTVLKPLAGADPSLASNLESFFEQDHTDMELVFGVERDDDPAIPIVQSLMLRYPNVPSKLIVHSGRRGFNPKVRNLGGMIEHASHDLVLISDSNVRAPTHYVREAAALFASDPSIGLVTHLFAGRGESTLASNLECVTLTGYVAAGTALPTTVGDAAVVGKSMLFSRKQLEPLGGLERVRDVLAEDYVIGKMFQRAGLRVVIAPTVLDNVVGAVGARSHFDRQLRWSMLRMRLRPLAFVLEPLSSPLVAFPFAVAALGPALALAWLAAMYVIRDAAAWLMLRGRSGLWAPLVLGPLRDAVALAVWAATPLKRHVSWRGNKLRLGAGTLLFAAR